ncbi:nucleotidyltransferase domain-containing protein [Clostridium sp.]|jgi:predicted nucleotidyltransferase|uniref:nucleotidyltransferase domain-containing protein n=1 Tax=Clostridium sp. TaxID=1506 RepID=UPI00258310C2|nr:nucleotidyltransferase domain-containing protein [Clostridium sp.]MDF2504181.1 nucleotidyltransferase [Clostridium sp.]
MIKTIIQYQKVFNDIVEKFKENENILAVMVFGSMVSGDLWEESDIDLLVIVKDKLDDMANIYVEEDHISVHIKLLNREKFIYRENTKGDFLHRVLSVSRLVFSRDLDITSKYDNGRYYPDMERGIWDLVYSGNLIKSLGICRKYISNNSIYICYSIAIRCAEEFAKLYVNYSGYMISNSAMDMALNMNDDFKEYVDMLFFNKDNVEESIKNIVDYIEEELNKNIRNITSLLLKYMRNKECFFSAEDMRKDKLFRNYNINFEDILNKLYELNTIKRDNRNFKTENGKTLVNENVYYI